MKFILALLLFLFSAMISFGQNIIINEFMADNETVIADQDDEYDDWVELVNLGDEPVELHGYGLSDDPDDLMQWMFPDTSIEAHGFLLIWADDDEEQEGLHTNFKLSASGEDICLCNPSYVVLDHVNFGPQTVDISYGRYPDGTGEFQRMYPTPGYENRSGGPDEINPGEGLFDPFTIHRIDFDFYVEDWQDSMEYNYEVLNEEYMPVHFTFNDTLEIDSVGIRYKGNSTYTLSQGTPKKPLKINIDKFNNSAWFFDIDILNLHNGVCDPTFMRETIAYYIARSCMPAPRTAYADVYVNGEYLGFYTLVEQIDEIFLSQHFENSTANLFKAGDDGAPLIYYGDNQDLYDAEYELKTNEDENDWSGFISMINVLNTAEDDEFLDVVGQQLNFDSCLRSLAFNMAISNFDSYTGSARNYYFYDDESDDRFYMLPWDVNEAFGVYSNGWDVVEQDYYDISNYNTRPLNRRLLEQESLKSVYTDYIRMLLTGAAAPDSVAEMVDALAPLIEDHVLADQNKLYTDDQFYRNQEEDVTIRDGRRVPGLKNFSVLRTAALFDQLSSELVFPGDTNNDGFVDAYDILPIGVYFLATGLERNITSLLWNGARCLPWTEIAATYADANGDGVVDERDVVAIGVNWGNSHLVSTGTFLIDPEDPDLNNVYRNNFVQLYNSLTGNSTAAIEMRCLMDSFMDTESTIPGRLTLAQNYPNPFNSTTLIHFSIPEEQIVHLTLYNILGQEVRSLIDNRRISAGNHEIILEAGANLGSGIYFLQLETNGEVRTRVLVHNK